LNSQLYRAIHLARQRDARQAAFPQVKIAHLRALPCPPHAPERWARLSELTARTSALGVNAELRSELDRAVFELFGLSAAEQTTVCAFLAERLPKARGPAAQSEPGLLPALGEASAPSTDSDTR
jgi:hypothetical protein